MHPNPAVSCRLFISERNDSIVEMIKNILVLSGGGGRGQGGITSITGSDIIAPTQVDRQALLEMVSFVKY